MRSWHGLQKKTVKEDDVPKNFCPLLSPWNFGIGGLGKYMLSKAFKYFFAEPANKVKWSGEKRNQHFAAFKNAKPKACIYEKLGNAREKQEIQEKIDSVSD